MTQALGHDVRLDQWAKAPVFNTDPASIFTDGKAPTGREIVLPSVLQTRTCTTTAASATVTCADTENILPGMVAIGTGVSDGQAVTTQDTGDTFTLASHGVPDGTPVYLTALGTTTGFDLNKIYYVVTTLANTFQLAASPGGTPLVVDADGTATVVFARYVTAVTTDTSLTLNIAASASGTDSVLSFYRPALAVM